MHIAAHNAGHNLFIRGQRFSEYSGFYDIHLNKLRILAAVPLFGGTASGELRIENVITLVHFFVWIKFRASGGGSIAPCALFEIPIRFICFDVFYAGVDRRPTSPRLARSTQSGLPLNLNHPSVRIQHGTQNGSSIPSCNVPSTAMGRSEDGRHRFRL